MRHRQIHHRVGLLRQRCACGCGWPCPDRYDRQGEVPPASDAGNAGPAWNAPTTDVPTVRPDAPWLTLGMRWRGNGGRWEP